MAKADVEDLVSNLSVGRAESAAVDAFYSEELRLLVESSPWLVSWALVGGTAGTSVYTVSGAARIIAAFYNARELYLEDPDDLSASVGTGWRGESGDPLAYVLRGETAATLRLYPTPTRNAATYNPLHGSALGPGYPADTLAVLHTDLRDDVPRFMELFLALRVVAREFSRDSAHASLDFSSAAGKLAALVLRMVV